MSGPFACKLCGAAGAVTMPGDIAVREVRCAACGRAQPVNAYASGAQQLFEEMARVQAAKAERDTKLREGVVCDACGGRMALPTDAMATTFACPFCGRQHLVTAFVDAKLIANQRLRDDLRGRIDAARGEARSRDRVVLMVVAALLAVGVVVAVVLGTR